MPPKDSRRAMAGVLAKAAWAGKAPPNSAGEEEELGRGDRVGPPLPLPGVPGVPGVPGR